MRIAFLICILSAVLLSGCLKPPEPVQSNITNTTPPIIVQNTTTEPVNKTTVANPAAVYCNKINYTYIIKNTTAGQSGYCSKGAQECGEWKLFLNECCLQNIDCSAKNCSDGPAYCSSQKCWCPIAQKNITAKNESAFFPPSTNKTLAQLLDTGLDSINSEVYSSMESGTSYTKKTFTWTLALLNSTQPPEEISLGTAMPAHIYINNRTDIALRGFAFSVYSPETSWYKVITMGLAMFLNQSQAMEGSYSKGTQFKVTYAPPQESKLLEKCEVQTRQVWKLSSGRYLYSYFFGCGVVWDR